MKSEDLHHAGVDSNYNGQGTPSYRVCVMTILILVYVLSYIDRVLSGIATPAIRADLNLSDFELGVINGAAFSVPFILAGFVLGWLADRYVRIYIMASAAAFWSICTAAFGAGHSFWALLIARIGVGIGEAGANVTSLAILIDYFPRRQLGRAIGIHSLGVPLGSASGVIVGAALIGSYGWHNAFYILGAVGTLLTPVILTALREPQRHEQPHGTVRLSPFESLCSVLSSESFLIITSAVSLAAIPIFATYFWFPSFFLRHYGISLSELAKAFSIIQFAAGITGGTLGGYTVDRLAKHNSLAYLLVPAMSYFVAACFIMGVILAPSPNVALLALFGTTTAQNFANAGLAVSYQGATSPTSRSMATSVFNGSTVMVGMGIGLPALGALSDFLKMKYGDMSLGYAMLTLTAFYGMAGTLFLYEVQRTRRGTARRSTLISP